MLSKTASGDRYCFWTSRPLEREGLSFGFGLKEKLYLQKSGEIM